MPGPWEKYQKPAESGPWNKYAPQIPDAGDLSNVPGALPGMQTPEQAAGIQAPKLQKSSVDYGKVLAAGDVGIGAGKGIAHTLKTIGAGEYALMPKALQNTAYGRNFGTGLNTVEQASTPTNTPQRIGYGGEQAGEFLIPGGAEEKGALKLASLAPRLGKFAEPLAKVATSALGAGTVNAAQGGGFGAGAAMGAGGAGLGQGIKAIAPMVAESAIGIPKIARAFGKTPGKAILEETRGIRPETVAGSAKERIGQLMPQLEQAAEKVSSRPQPIRGLLTAPPREIPLPNAPDVEGRLSQPVRLTQIDRPTRPMLQAPSLSTPMAPGLQAEFPGRLASANTEIRPTEFGSHPGMGQAQFIGEIPGERGGLGQSHGVLIRPAESIPGALPSTVPNRIASLGPARNVLEKAMTQAERENAQGLHRQIGGMREFLGRRFGTGEPIPENVTPRELLDLKRGLNEEHLGWNPEIHDRAVAAGRQAYGALDTELDRVVPQGAQLNQRISSLIPVARRAESVSRNAPTLQRALGRFGAHTGALAGAGIGGSVGYKEGGLPGAVAGGLTGIIAPELIASPEGQMALARTLYKTNALRRMVGATAQFTRKKEKK